MKPIEAACYCLIASAFVLAGLLLSNISESVEKEAQARMVVNRQNFTIMTTRTRRSEEAVFVLNNLTDRMLIYTLNLQRNELELVGNEDMARQFSLPGAGGGQRGGGQRSR